MVSETFFLVKWRDEDSHSVISAQDLQDPTCAPNLKKGADVNIVERRTKRVCILLLSLIQVSLCGFVRVQWSDKMQMELLSAVHVITTRAK